MGALQGYLPVVGGKPMGERIKIIRTMRNLTIDAVATMTGISKTKLTHIEDGSNQAPLSAESLLLIAEALDIDPRFVYPTAKQSLFEFDSGLDDTLVKTWSVSKLGDYLKCPAYFHFKHVQGLKSPHSMPTAMGHAVHKGIENLYLMFLKPDEAIEPIEAFEVDLGLALEDIAPDPEDPKIPPVEDLVEEGIKILQTYVEDVASKITPVAVERRVEIQVAGVPFTVITDVIDTDGMVRDTKVAKSRPTLTDIEENLQATAISLAYRATEGKPEKGVVFDYLVRNKKPVYAAFPTVRTEKDHTRLARVVEGVIEASERGIFYPNPSNKFGCAQCPFRAQCHETF